LIHTVLTRRGLTRAAVLPVSLVLLTRSREYVDGLTSYRHHGSAGSPEAAAGIGAWLEMFLRAVSVAAEQAREFIVDLEELGERWSQRHALYLSSLGLSRPRRADSAVMRLLPLLHEVPVTTAHTAQRLLGVSDPAARAALEELADAKILSRKRVDRGRRRTGAGGAGRGAERFDSMYAGGRNFSDFHIWRTDPAERVAANEELSSLVERLRDLLHTR